MVGPRHDGLLKSLLDVVEGGLLEATQDECCGVSKRRIC